MKIRHGNIGDLQTISKIEALSYPAEEGASESSLRERLICFPEYFWILEEQGDILAFINGMATNEGDLADEMYDNARMHTPDGDWQMIFSVVTAPQFRGRGYASALMRRVIADCRDSGRKGIVLTCKETLLPFYARLGFQNEGVSKSHHGNAVWYQMRIVF